MDKSEALQLVVDYISGLGGELVEHELTPSKIRNRAVLVDDPQRLDWIVFEVERHRGILGTFYTPGRPMTSFVTYWPRFAFHPVTKSFECLGEFCEPTVHIDYDSLAERAVEDMSFSFSPGGGARLRCRDVCSNKECLVRAAGEVEEFALQIVRGWDYEVYASPLSEFLDPTAIHEVLDEIRSAVEGKVRMRARKDWELYHEGEI